MSKIINIDENSGTDITYLPIGEQAILLKVMGLLKLDNSGMQTIKSAIYQKRSMFQILVAAGKRRSFVMKNKELPVCFEWYVEYLENLGMKIPNYQALSIKFMNLSKDEFTKKINEIDAQIQLRKITLAGKVVEQKIGEAIVQAVVSPKVEPLMAGIIPRKERTKEISKRIKSINNKIIDEIMSYVNYDKDKLSYSFILELVQLFQNDSLVCKSILTGLKKEYLYSSIFNQVEKRGSFKGKVQLLKLKYQVLFDDQHKTFMKKVLEDNARVSDKTESKIINAEQRVITAESNIVKSIKGSIFDILQDAEELSGIECNEYSKIAFLKVISTLTKRKKYFFKAQALKLLELIEKLEIENELGQEFLDCLDCFAFYKKNLDELNQG